MKLFYGSIIVEEVKFLLKMSPALRSAIKRNARKEGVTMNEFITIILEQFVQLQGEKNGNAKRGGSA